MKFLRPPKKILSGRALEIMTANLSQSRQNTNRIFAALLLLQLIATVFIALLVSPWGWSGTHSKVHLHVWSAFGLGTLLTFFPILLCWRWPNSAVTRHVIAGSQLLFSALLIHVSGGRIETHFHIFASLAFLAFYLDWKILITASVITVTDHLIRGYVWPQSIYGVLTASPWRSVEHAGWVILEDFFLIIACNANIKNLLLVSKREADLEEKNLFFESQVSVKTAELASANLELSSSNNFLNAILDAQSSSILILDQHGNMKHSNAAWKEIWKSNVGPDKAFHHTNYWEVCNRSNGECTEEAMQSAQKIRSVLSGETNFESLTYACHGPAEQRWFTMELTPFDAPTRHVVVVHKDVTAEHIALQKITDAYQENRRLASILEKTTNAAVLTDSDQKITWVNRSYERITGYSFEEALGKTHSELLGCDGSDPATLREYRKACEERRSFHGLLRCRRKDGHEFWLDNDLHPIRNEQGVIDGFVAIKSDVTELVLERKKAESASRSKSEFLANMSHEIRTPMTAILGFADLLDTDDYATNDEFRAKNAIQTIRSNANHLLTIINDILDMSKIDAGCMTVECIDTNAIQVIEEVVSLMQPRALGSGLKVVAIYHGAMPSKIKSDPTRFRQILSNLVGNAVKFTAVGGVAVHARLDCENQRLICRIVDTGIGMTHEQTENIAKFEAFSQADTSHTRQFEGTGLGLRIANSLAKLLGGGIEVESARGKGSTFSVSVSTGEIAEIDLLLPEQLLKSIHASRQPKESQVGVKPAAALRLKGLQILLAEDGPDNQRLIGFYLKKEGAQVTIAENGLVAAELIERNNIHFDLVFMDMQMPELDGYASTARLRKGGYTIPIIALTAHAMDGDRKKCIDAGCDEYTTKPIQREQLIDLAERYGRRNDLPNLLIGHLPSPLETAQNPIVCVRH